VVNALLLAATIPCMAAAGAGWAGFDPFAHPTVAVHGLPFALTLAAILLVHEAGHYVMCVRHGVNASLPYFVPAPPIPPLVGTFGAFIRIRSRFPNRRALFDIGAAGPWAGLVVALIATAVGLSLSTVLEAPPQTAVVELGDSLVTKLLIWLVLDVDPARVVLHPIALAGWFGLFVTSLNLIPIGQLDGGHVLYAAFGRTRFLPTVLVAFLLWLGLTGWPGWVLWALILSALTMLGHPTTDDPQPLDPQRFIGALATLALFVLTFVAEPLKFIGELQ
jgi:membrane-associated protease RseP (regulator of RpoE activity)